MELDQQQANTALSRRACLSIFAARSGRMDCETHQRCGAGKMTTNTIESVLARLEGVKAAGSDNTWSAYCPVHENPPTGHTRSLSVTIGDNGTTLVHCHAGCSQTDVLAAVRGSLPPERMFPKSRKLPKAPPKTEAVTYPTADAAIQSLESKMGKPSAVWEYQDFAWDACGYVLRWDSTDGKTYRPISRNSDSSWFCGAMPTLRPLYRLPFIRELGDDDIVWITEGEKAADACVSIGLEATTSPGGSQSPHKADWKPLRGRDCVILPDNDKPGLKYAYAVRDILFDVGVRSVKILRLPGLPDKGDVCDFLQRLEVTP